MNENQLMKVATLLRGKMETTQYTNFILSLIAYQMLSTKHKIEGSVYDGMQELNRLYPHAQGIDLFDSELFKDQALVDQILPELDISKIDSHSFGDIYERILGFFSKGNSAIFGEFYTPKELAELQAQLTITDKTKSIYDPTCGAGGLILQGVSKVEKFYGQELNKETFKICRKNLLIHGLSHDQCDIRWGDTLASPQHVGQKFDAILANPPFSVAWEQEKFKTDSRFGGVLAPKKAADLAFVQHMISHLSDDGICSIVLPHGVLFRGSNEQKIREHLIKKNYLDTVIGLPPKIFQQTDISTCMLILKKNRESTDILFIDAKDEFEKVGKKNKLINTKIIEAVKNRGVV
jgi:type I restriction enzyme M protein